MSKFSGIEVIVSQNVLDRHEKNVLLLETVGTWKKLVIALKKIVAAICLIVEDLAYSRRFSFFFDPIVASIYL